MKDTTMGRYPATPLVHTIQAKQEVPAIILVEAGADCHAADTNGWTCLHLAVRSRQKKLVNRMLELGADANTTNNTPSLSLRGFLGYRPLDIAARESLDEPTPQLLLDHGAEINGKTLITEETPIFAILGTKVNPFPPKTPTEMISTARFLLDHGAEIDACNAAGETLLYRAILGNNFELVTFLIERGASLAFRSKQGDTLLHIASRNGNPDGMKYLLQHGADPSAQNKDGHTPLYTAAQSGKLESVKTLLRYSREEEKVEDKDGKWPCSLAPSTLLPEWEEWDRNHSEQDIKDG